MSLKRLFYIFTILLFQISDIFGSNFSPIDIISVDNGLSHTGVTSIIKDSRGYLWMGSYDGLNRYNGSAVSVYKNRRDSMVFGSNRIRTVAEDNRGRIWIGTESGISIFDYDKNRFYNHGVGFFAEKGVQANFLTRKIIPISDDRMLALTENEGALIFDYDMNLLRVDTLKSSINNDIIKLDSTNYLICSNKGLSLYDVERGVTSSILPETVKIATTAAINAQGVIFVALQSNGIIKIKSQKFSNNYNFIQIDETILPEYQIRAITFDSQNGAWIGTQSDGILHLNSGDDWSKEAQFISENMRISTFLDGKNNDIWVGTFDCGVMRYSEIENPFISLEINNDKNCRISELAIFDSENIIIRPTNEKTLLYNTQNNTCRPLLPPPYQNSRTIFCNSEAGGIWVVVETNRRYKIFKLIDGNLTPYQSESSLELNREFPRAISEDIFGNLWLGYANRVCRVVLSDDQILDIQNINIPTTDNKTVVVRELYSDKLGKSLWIGTATHGLYRVTKLKNRKSSNLLITRSQNNPNNHKSIASNFISEIKRSRDGELWIGMEHGGICRVENSLTDSVELHFTNFSEQDGLQHNVVKSFEFDSKGNLWIATNRGISFFDTEAEKFRSFTKKDGLPFDIFSYASLKLDNGIFIFAGIEGAVKFDVAKISKTDKIPQFHFGEFRIFNTPIKQGEIFDGRELFSSRLCSGDTLRLKHNENLFSLEIESLLYDGEDNSYINYQLLPLNKKWIQQDITQSFLTFSGLRHGEYRLNVEITNDENSKVKSNQIKSLIIIIEPSFWQSPIAYLMYVVLFIIILVLAVRVLLRMQQLKYSYQLESIAKDNISEKLRYFSNIAHEIKTPLTLILTPLTSLMESYRHDSNTFSRLQRAAYQTKKIAQLIDLVQAIQLNDLGLLNSKKTNFNFTRFFDDMVIDFKMLASGDSKNLIVDSPQSDIIINADRAMMEHILNNLLSNSVKYTSKGDSIVVKWHNDQKNLYFEVTDSGMGISPEDLSHVFDRFYRSNKVKSITGSGIGLSFTKRLIEIHNGEITASSVLGEGTTFKFVMPIISSEKVEIESISDENDIIFDDLTSLSDIEAKGQFKESLLYLVEDNNEMRQMMKEILSRFYRVESFENGKLALDAIISVSPDIIVSDVMMPEMDGFELCSRVKSDIENSHIPIILLTACGTMDDRIKGMEYGADLYIQKPFYPKYVVTCIETLLSSRMRLREHFSKGGSISVLEDNTVQSSKDSEFLTKLYSLLEENLDNEEIDVNIFARELGVNRSLFFKKVKALTDHTPFDLIKEYRLSKASELLSKGEYSVSQVCSMTGFKSRTHFSKLFKERFGVTPSKFN
ncbi:MAG: two-component regulator propeller domain-containing protein [Rikenellaceae bacterium]